MSADNNSRAVVQRHQFADYLNLGTSTAPNYVLMGVGFTTLDESPGAQTSSKKYVNEKTTSTSITSYETQFPFESDLIKSQDAVIALYNVGRNHYTGEDAEFEYVRVELWDAMADNYVLTSDTAIDSTKTYYTRSGSEGSYVYTPVETPEVADISTYYENTASGCFAARKFRVACEVSETSGEDDQVVSGNLNAVGDPTFGYFNTTTKTFTATS